MKKRANKKRDPSLLSGDDLVLPCASEQVFRIILSTARTPIAEEILKLLSEGDYTSLVKKKVDPSNYTDPQAFKVDYLLTSMMSKFDSFDLGIDTAAVALSGFRESELMCKQTNETIDEIARREHFDPSTAAVLFMARRKIYDLLGNFDWNECAKGFAWGPGASTSKKRQFGDAYYKFGQHVHATPNLAPLVEPLKKWLSPWDFEVSWVKGSKGTTVPKNAEKDRFIAIEPDLNLFIQKGIGKMIRSRLQRVGLLRKTAQYIQGVLAKLASKHKKLATVDLKAASDSIAMRLVELLLPEDWIEAIKLCRSPFCVLPDGDEVYLQKVSSMGNGFTFELETLIFWALARSWVDLLRDKERTVSVYGDDIIMSSEAAPGFYKVLEDCGFQVNPDKSYFSGPFRESCGKHFFDGQDVTPFFIKRPVDSVDRYFWLANTVALWSAMGPGALDATWKPAYDFICAGLPLGMKTLPIPLTAGRDSGLYRNLDQAMSLDVDFCHRYQSGWLYPSLRPKAIYRDRGGHRRLIKSLYRLERSVGVENTFGHDGEWQLLPDTLVREYARSLHSSDTVRGGVTRPSNFWRMAVGRHRSWCSQWFDLGVWIS